MAWTCLWILTAVSAAQVPFAVAKKDIESYWKKSWPAEALLELNAAGPGIASEKIINLKKVPYYSVPARAKVKRADGSVATFSVSAIYKRPGTSWVFENVATGNVQQEKTTGQDAPSPAEAETLIKKGWTDRFTQEGDTDITIHKVHPGPAFKAYGQRYWYTYKIDVDYTSGNARYECKGQKVDLVKENSAAPWTFKAMKDTSTCQGRNLR
jgi:hypothetical protein